MKIKQVAVRIFLLFTMPLLTFCAKEEAVIQDSDAWKTINTGEFAVDVPENWMFNRLPGIDSHVGLLTNKKDSLVFDYGLYSNKLEVDTAKYDIHFETIHGRNAKIVKSSLPGETPFGMYIDSVNVNPIGKESFTINQVNARPMEEAKVLRVFRSIRF